MANIKDNFNLLNLIANTGTTAFTGPLDSIGFIGSADSTGFIGPMDSTGFTGPSGSTGYSGFSNAGSIPGGGGGHVGAKRVGYILPESRHPL